MSADAAVKTIKSEQNGGNKGKSIPLKDTETTLNTKKVRNLQMSIDDKSASHYLCELIRINNACELESQNIFGSGNPHIRSQQASDQHLLDPGLLLHSWQRMSTCRSYPR
jgi:hypothetical protein